MRDDLHITLAVEGAQGASASARSVLDAATALPSHALQRLAELFPDFFSSRTSSCVPQLLLNVGDLFRVEPVDCSTLGADEVVLAVNPTDRYCDFVSAVSLDADVACERDPHGWPILSIVAAPPMVAEAGEESILPSGGKA